MTYTITKNNQFNSLEIMFNGKPSEAVREALKGLKFRWHNVKRIWYGYASEEAAREAIEGKKATQGAGKAKKAEKASKAAGTPQERIKFYWNGIKVNGGNLIKCSYSASDYNGVKSVGIYADGYGAELPRDLFDVKNETDVYTDYFDTDKAYIEESSPLYKYALYAAQSYDMHYLKLQITHDKKRIAAGKDVYGYDAKRIKEYTEKIAKLEAVMKDPGQPTAEDLEQIDRQRQEAENARRAAEHEEQLKRREAEFAKRVHGQRLIDKEIQEHPQQTDAPCVLIHWSEHPAFTRYADDSLLLSLTAAENILRTLDTEQHETRETENGSGWYYKTKFTIYGKDEAGEPFEYSGRYDLGDGEGGLIQHIRSIGEWHRTHTNTGAPIAEPEETNETIQFADYLETFIKPDEDEEPEEDPNEYMQHIFYEIG